MIENAHAIYVSYHLPFTMGAVSYQQSVFFEILYQNMI